MPVSEEDRAAIAERILAVGDAASSIAPITDALAGFDLADAYSVSAMVTRLRVARGERPVGWKIGFTNRTIWDEYGVHAPIWGPMYASTVEERDPAQGPLACPIGHLVEPRIEPEIALRIAATPHGGMDEGELMSCIDGVAHGFEIVQSIFPGWIFKAADTVAAFALHGSYRHGPFARVETADRDAWRGMLSGFEIALSRNGDTVDVGVATNVLGGGPLSALRHLVRGLAKHPNDYGLRPGDIVTTGTLTRAFPISRGERWSTRLTGLTLPGMSIVFE